MHTCPCGRSKPFNDCCALAHANPIFIKTAEDLMRSRYTAFTLANGPYLIETHHSETRKNVDEQEIVNWAKSVKWERLEIISKTNGLEGDEHGTVEFKAYFKEKGKMRYIHENSLFKREYGVWMYFGMLD
jgi:SEC-C motif-containing protein